MYWPRTKTLIRGLFLATTCALGSPFASAQEYSPLYLEGPAGYLSGPIWVPMDVRFSTTLDAGGVSSLPDIVLSDGVSVAFLDLGNIAAGLTPLPAPEFSLRALTTFSLFPSPSGRPQLLAAGDNRLYILSVDYLGLGWIPLLDLQVRGLAAIDLGGATSREELVLMLPNSQCWAFDVDGATWTGLSVPPVSLNGLFVKQFALPALGGAVVPTLFGISGPNVFFLDTRSPVPGWIGPISREFGLAASTTLPGLPISIIAPTPVNATDIGFVNVTPFSGLGTHTAIGSYYSSGVLFTDLTGDGYPDVYLPQWNQPNLLFENGGGGGFSQVTAGAGAPDPGLSTGAVAADFDNDGNRDLFVLNLGRNTLYRNQGGSFVDVTDSTDPTPADPAGDKQEGVGFGIDTDGAILANSMVAAWSDVDRDGFVDLYVGNHCASCAEGERDILYRNNGNGTFTDITVSAGIETAAATRVDTSTQAVEIADLNMDGWPDIYVAQRQAGPSRDRLYLNKGDANDDGIWDGGFTEYFSSQPDPLLGNTSPAALGVDFGDYDNDGDLDVYITDIGQMDLYRNLTVENGGQFALAVVPNVPPFFSVGWGAGWLDVDNDGDQDLHIPTNGGLMDHLFRNDGINGLGAPILTDVTFAAGLGEAWNSRGAAYADYDLDGWVDALIINRDGIPVALHRNLTGDSQSNLWVEIALQGDPTLGGGPFRSNRDAIGARVEVFADVDGDGIVDRQVQEVRAGGHALGSMSSSTLHFGLGASPPVSIIVDWPSGRQQRLSSRPVNQRIEVVEADEYSEGWTEFTASADTKIFYVSPTGQDSNNGLTPNTAKRTIAAGTALLRDGFPDWLLLQRGGIWNEWISMTKSGRSATEPMLISSYGTGPRPKLESPSGYDGIANYRGGVEHVAVVGLELTEKNYAGSGQGNSGVYLLGWFNDLLFEDLYIHDYSAGVVIQNQVVDPYEYMTNIRLRRSVIEKIYTTGSEHSQGLYGEGIDGMLIEECVFYRCGFDEDVPGSYPTIFRHACYLQVQTRNITARRNITLETSSHGYQFRGSNTIAEDNLLARTAIAFLLGGGDEPYLTPDGGASGVLRRNVVFYGRDIDAGAPRGFAFTGSSINWGVVRENLFANTIVSHEYSKPFAFGRSQTAGNIGINNLTIEDNVVYNWKGHATSRDDSAAVGSYTNILFRNNQIQVLLPQSNPPWILSLGAGHAPEWTSGGNRFFYVNAPSDAFEIAGTAYDLAGWKLQVGDSTSVQQQVAYPDPTRTPERYVDFAEGLPPGTSTFKDFVNKVRQRSKDNWNPLYRAEVINGWLREGFGMAK